MRLMYVIPGFDLSGGVSRSARRMVEIMRTRGHHVVAAGPDDALFPGDVRTDHGTYRFGAGDPDSVEELEHRVARAASDLRPDLLVGYYGTSAGRWATGAARAQGLPVVVCLRGNDVDRDAALLDRGSLVREAVAGADAVTTVSREMASKVTDRFGVEAQFITNSVDRLRFYPDHAAGSELRARWGLDGRPVLGLFGEFKHKRGLARLAGLGEALAGWQVVLVGRLRPEVRNDAPAAWRRMGYMDTMDELRGAYSACDVVAQPSLYDGMPNVVLEAMACARVVVASPVGGLPDVIEHQQTGLLCATDSQWSETLASLHQDPRPDLGVAARRAVPGPDQEARAFEALFSRVIQGQR